MQEFLLKNACTIISIITACIIFGPCLWFLVGQTSPSTDLIAAIVAVLIGIISISLPIIIGNTAQRLAVYNNKYIASIFREEPAYKRMLHMIPILIGIIIAFFFFSYSENSPGAMIISRIIAIAAVVLCVYALVVFRNFWSVFSEYTINTDSVVLEKITAKVQNLLHCKISNAEYLDYMDMYYQILCTKLKAESFVNLIDILKKQSDLILGVFNNLSGYENNPELKNNLEALFQKYHQSAYLCWQKSFRENEDAAKNALAEYYRVLNEVLPHVKSHATIIYRPLIYLYQRITRNLTVRDVRSIPYCKVVPWRWYMNMLSSGVFSIEILDLLDEQLLEVMAVVIQNGNRPVFNSFIAHTIDGIWYLESPISHIPDRNLKAQKYKIKNTLSLIFSWSELKNLEERITEKTRNESLKQDLQKYIQYHYKYNHIRLVVIILGAYCLFKKRYDYIKYILHYNQPEKGQASFLNPDIIPHDLNILLKLYAESYALESLFHHIWEDHNDGQYWFKKFVSLLACKSSHKEHFNYNGHDNKQQLEHYRYCIEEMQQELNKFETDTVTACGLTEEQLGAAKNELRVFDEEIQDRITRLIETQQLSSEKIERFKNAVLQQIQSNSIWTSILKKNTDTALPLARAVGYKILIEKSFLADGDTGIYIDFERSIAQPIVRQIDFFIEQSLRFRTPAEGPIMKSNLRDKIFELDDSWIVLFINYRNLIEWFGDKPDFKWGRKEAHLVGTTGKGTSIYSTFDSADRGRRVFLFREADFSKILGVSEINVEITNLYQNEDLIQEILHENPHWLEKYDTDEAKRRALQKQVQINMSGVILFGTSPDPEVYVFDNL